ncbi:chromosomal replication initiator protein DnaA [Thalassoglobus sp. JC818]|uniref:chromosomal replication initiator protein DnaA n=1 Tax=Thalassoglobus sp. JC818 TaxID=3232136 RepID=UPI00345B48CB
MPPERMSVHQEVESIQKHLEDQIGSKRYENWFGTSTRLQVQEAELVVYVASPYLVKWIQKKFGVQLGTAAAEVMGPSASVRYEVGFDIPPVVSVKTPQADEPAGNEQASSGSNGQMTYHAQPSTPSGSKKQYSTYRATTESNATKKRRIGKRSRSLTDFVVGPCNELAVAAVHQVVAEPGSVSPLYLYSSVGNGKTHLLESIYLRLRREAPHLQVLNLTAEQFINYFTQAYSAKSLPSFRQKFRSVDVLLVDDVDFLDGKKATQEEFLHTIKEFELAGKQVVVTANRHPQLLAKTPDELSSRLVSGLVCRLDRPQLETRREVVRRHSKRQGCEISESVVEAVANRMTGSCRELEGAVNILSTWSQMTKKKITVTIAKKLLSQLERDCLRIVRLADVEDAVCGLFGVGEGVLKSKTRKQSVAQPRMLAMYLARKLTQTPYSEIGQYFGGRNHSTVMSAERKIDHQLQESGVIRIASETWQLQDLIDTLKDRIQAG